jgi:hypothetical protein
MSTNNVRDLRDTIIPKSDQLNADDLLTGPMTITVTSVRRGATEDQPIAIHYEGDDGRPYKPCKTMRRLLVAYWKEDGGRWVGRRMTLYHRADVKFGGVSVGGIRISHMSHIESDIRIQMTATRGKKEPIIVKKLDDHDPAGDARTRLRQAAGRGTVALREAWAEIPAEIKKVIDPSGCPDELKKIAAKADQPQPAPDNPDFPLEDRNPPPGDA